MPRVASHPVVARMTDQLGRVLGGRYRLVAAIGTGASAQVFLADDLTLHRRVAVKVLHPALAVDEGFLRRFRAEARAAAALSHPNLMAVYDWGEDDGPYLVLEHLGGGSLRAMLDRNHRLSTAQALVVGLEAARALDVAHRKEFVHRDIKPANLLFGEDGRLRIADFGLARALSEAGWTDPGDGLVGTARYAAPEQARGGRIDGRADVYALGLVLTEAVTGTVPLTGDGALETMMARVDNDVPVPPEMGPLKPILERMGRADPEQRPDAAEVGRTLVGLARDMDRPAPLPLAGVDLAATQAVPLDDITRLPGDDVTVHRGPDATGLLPPVPPSERRSRRWPWVLLGILALAAIVAGAVVVISQMATPSADVPRVETLPLEEARERIAAADRAAEDVEWTVDERHAFDENVLPGHVISQQPDPGDSLDDGGTIRIVVSDGPPPVKIPSIGGATLEAATQALATAEFSVAGVVEEHHETAPPQTVITWRFGGADAPAEAPKRSGIELVVSKGPPPRTVPDVRGASEADARARLEQLGLKVARTDVFSDDVEKGLVVRTNPPAGGSAARDSTVTLFVSKGPELVEVPTVLGRTYDEALSILEAAGLTGGTVTGQGNIVSRTDPAPGQFVRKGTAVNITLRRR